ncbi:MAG: PAS domain S-box protein [Rhodospirillaceae bacterium]
MPGHLNSVLAVVLGAAIAGVAGLAVWAWARRRQRARESRGESAKYQAVVDTAVDPIVVINAVGIVQSFNPAAEHTFGYTADEVIGRNVKMLMGEPHHTRHDNYLHRYLKTREPRIIGIGREVEGLRKDGSTFPLELSVAAWTADGTQFFTGIMRDITERKQAERALTRERDRAENERARAEAEKARAEVERDRAERVDRAKTNFLAAASHDLRQPVQSLIFQAHALGQRITGSDTAPILARLNESLDAMRALLDGLLDMSRLEAGSVRPRPVDMNLGHLINRLSADLRPAAEAKGLRLRVVSRGAWTHSDAILLERMIRNLLENAVTHTPHGKILFGLRGNGAHWRIDVIDTGPGIPPHRQSDIFDDFVQLGNESRDRGQGLGLGLPIVRRLAVLLDHEIGLSSRVGRGTRFSIRVPRIAPPKSDVPHGRRRDFSAPGGGPLLVIDDEALIALGLRDVLESWGHEVVIAGSWAEALRRLKDQGSAPAAILTDYRLRAGETGTDVIRLLRDHFGAHIPALVMTGDTAPDRLRALNSQGLDVLHKPVTPADLADGLKRLGR